MSGQVLISAGHAKDAMKLLLSSMSENDFVNVLFY